MTFSAFPLLFLQASITTLTTCSLAWALLQLACRRWPELEARRSPWLLALAAGAFTLALVMLPASSQLSLFAAPPQAAVAGLAGQAPVSVVIDLLPGGSDDLSADEALPALAWLWLGCYMAGAAWHAWRWQRVRRALRALLNLADRLDGPALDSHPAFAGQPGRLPAVLELDAPVSPMLAGLFHPVLVLPRHMRAFPPAQQQMIVAHELMHLQRRDHLWQHAGSLLQALLWFVPAAYSFRRRLQWALELGCDSAVLAGRPDGARRSYAAALLAQLAVQLRAGDGHPQAMGLAFGQRSAQAVALRIRLIRDARTAAQAPWAGMAALLLLPGLCGASVLLQPQFAWNQAAHATSPAPIPAKAGATAATSWQAPLATLRVTSEFGSVNRPGGKPHGGMDLGAKRGTPVIAPASGRVAVSTDRYAGGARYGKVVVIDHADGSSSLYAHLDGRLVQAGEMVRAGQQIALTGATGKVTGPHLHFEVSRHGVQVDPHTLLGGAAQSRRASN